MIQIALEKLPVKCFQPVQVFTCLYVIIKQNFNGLLRQVEKKYNIQCKTNLSVIPLNNQKKLGLTCNKL
jgi:hypothetical protein